MRIEHLTDSEISGFLDRDLDPISRQSVEVHLESCKECREAVADVSRLSFGYTSNAGLSSNRKLIMTGKGRAVGVGGALIAASIAILAITRSGLEPDDVAPAASTRTASLEAHPALAALEPQSEYVNARDLRLVWRPSQTDTYRVVIMDATGAAVMERETSDTTFVLPESVQLQPGQVYFWRVDAISDGVTASTGARKLIVAR